MTVVWREQSETDVPPRDDWLNPRERARMTAMHFAKRRTDWRLGRWTAICAVAAYLDLPVDPGTFQELEIRSAASGAPEVWRGNRPATVAISLSHRDGTAVCAAAPPWAQVWRALSTKYSLMPLNLPDVYKQKDSHCTNCHDTAT